MAKLDRLATLETADGIAADDGRACDRVMGWARRLQASQGIAAAVGEAERRVLAENGLNQEEIEEVARTLDLLRKSSRGSFPRQRLIALLEACGAPQGEGDVQQAERIYYRGQAAALLAVDRRWSGEYREDDKLIERILSSDEGVSRTITLTREAPREPPALSVEQVAPATKPAESAPAGSAQMETSVT